MDNQILPTTVVTISKINLGFFLFFIFLTFAITPKIVKEFPNNKTNEKIEPFGVFLVVILMINIAVVLTLIGFDKYESRPYSYIFKDLGLKFLVFFIISIAIALISVEIDKVKYLYPFESKN